MTIAEEIETLKAKLAASQRLGDGYGDRIKAIAARIKQLEDASETDDR